MKHRQKIPIPTADNVCWRFARGKVTGRRPILSNDTYTRKDYPEIAILGIVKEIISMHLFPQTGFDKLHQCGTPKMDF